MNQFNVFILSFLSFLLSAVCPDKVFVNTKIYTLNESMPNASVLAIKADKIHYIGNNSIDLDQCSGTKVYDLEGSYVYPGFVDSHSHLRGVGFRELNLDLSNTFSKEEMLARTNAYLAKNPNSALLVGRGWIEKNWANKAFPTRFDLDSISNEIPIILERADGHAVVVNSVALQRANITSTTKNPSGGEIERDENGEPNGLLIDNAQKLVMPLIPTVTRKEQENAFVLGAKVYASRGWTGTHDADALPIKDVLSYEKLDLNFRVHFSLTKNDYLFCKQGQRSIKIYADGALGSRGAALLESYEDKDSRGLVLLDSDIDSYLRKIAMRNCQIQIHAIGDRGNQMVLNAYEKAYKDFPKKDLRWRIEHAQNVIEADRKRFKDLNIIASMQPSHAIGDLHFAEDRLGFERLSNAYTWKSFIDDGVVVVGGSDAPVEVGDPIIEFYAAVTRKDLDGYSNEGWNLQQALSREEALAIFTKWPAYAIFKEDKLGTLEIGKLADITIFDQDIMTIPNEDILATKVVMTVVGGKIVYING